MSEVVVEQLLNVTDAAVEQINLLLPQLSANAPSIDARRLGQILAMPGSLYVARLDGRIIGMVQRVDVYQPRRVKSWIEDYVVDEDFRGRGIATKLLSLAVAAAPSEADSINLTSKLERVEAHKLYSKLGFERRDETSVWRHKLS